MITRILAALILIPIVIFTVTTGGIYYRIFISFIFAAGTFEFIRSHKMNIGIINKTLTIIAILIFINLGLEPLNIFFNLSIFSTMILLIISINFLFLPPKIFYDKIKLLFFTLIYLGCLGLNFNILFFKNFNGMPTGILNILYVLLLTWSCDTGAYFTGRFLGKKKLAPILSPKKTIEGAIGGIVASIVFSIFYFIIVNKNNNYNWVFWLNITLLPIILSFLCILGDLGASAIKRASNIKDYSNIIPGHGGIIDRIDSLLFTITFMTFYCNLIDKLFGII